MPDSWGREEALQNLELAPNRAFVDRFRGDPGLGMGFWDYGQDSYEDPPRDNFMSRYWGNYEQPNFWGQRGNSGFYQEGQAPFDANTFRGIWPQGSDQLFQEQSSMDWLRNGPSPDFNQRFRGDRSGPGFAQWEYTYNPMPWDPDILAEPSPQQYTDDSFRSRSVSGASFNDRFGGGGDQDWSRNFSYDRGSYGDILGGRQWGSDPWGGGGGSSLSRLSLPDSFGGGGFNDRFGAADNRGSLDYGYPGANDSDFSRAVNWSPTSSAGAGGGSYGDFNTGRQWGNDSWDNGPVAENWGSGGYADMLGPTSILRGLVEHNSRAIDQTAHQIRNNTPSGWSMSGTGNLIPSDGGYFQGAPSGGTNIYFQPGVGASYGWA